VVAGNLVVGAVIFLILTMIQIFYRHQEACHPLSRLGVEEQERRGRPDTRD
jgi:hypothetical protein